MYSKFSYVLVKMNLIWNDFGMQMVLKQLELVNPNSLNPYSLTAFFLISSILNRTTSAVAGSEKTGSNS